MPRKLGISIPTLTFVRVTAVTLPFRLLLFVKAGVGPGEEVRQRFRTGVVVGIADAERKRVAEFFGLAMHFRLEGLADFVRLGIVVQFGDDIEFITTEARDKAAPRPANRPEDFRHKLQGAVTLVMTERIVNLLELVQIYHEQVKALGERILLRLRMEVQVKLVAVVQARQRVNRNQVRLRQEERTRSRKHDSRREERQFALKVGVQRYHENGEDSKRRGRAVNGAFGKILLLEHLVEGKRHARQRVEGADRQVDGIIEVAIVIDVEVIHEKDTTVP